MIEKNKKYNLEDRTSKLGEDIILFCRKIRQDTITRPLISQLIRSATSIGANYCEANGACSKKESQESKYWLHMISVACPESKESARKLWKEVQELTLIFGKIVSTLKN